MEKIDFWKGLKEYDSEKVAKFMKDDFIQRLELFQQKDAGYGGSWQKDGLNGAFLNLKRKWDRLEHIFKKGELFEESSVENIDDTMMDLENYAAMFSYLLIQKRQELETTPIAVAKPSIPNVNVKQRQQSKFLKSVPQANNFNED